MSIALMVACVATLILAGCLVTDLDFDAGDGWLSLTGATAFTAVAGFAIYGASGMDASMPVTVGLAACFGVAAVAGTRYLTRFLTTSQTPPPSLDAVRGTVGRVTVAITDRAAGQIAASVDGVPVRLNAVSDTPLPFDTEVLVIDVLSPTQVAVRPLP